MGGGKGGSARTPKQAPNSLFSTSIARFIDFLGVGTIGGVVGGDKGIYINEVPLQAADDSYNFAGVTTYHRTGTANQSYISGFEGGAPSATNVNTQLMYNIPVTRSITDTDVDRASVTVYVPALQEADAEDGDIDETSVTIRVHCNDILVEDITIDGKCTATYQRTLEIDDLLNTYGAAPWEIKLTRLTADSSSSYLANTTYWLSYDEIIDGKFMYPYAAQVGMEVDSELFGVNIPARAYLVDGLECQVPDNRDAATRTYSGEWTGGFQTETTDNPAWILYTLWTDVIWGMGKSADLIDAAALYTIGVNNDTMVPYYDAGVSGTEPRYTFNYAFYQGADAFETIKAICSSMNVQPYWAGGVITFTQDSAADPAMDFNQTNVLAEGFTYVGTALKARHTRAYVTWYDPEDMYRPAVALVEDAEGIQLYGVRDVRLTAAGCTSRGQAIRKGKWILDTDKNATETVTFISDMSGAYLAPGEIIRVFDREYTDKRWGGRIVSATVDEIVMDTPLTFVGGNTYHLDVYTPSGVLLFDQAINNPGIATNTIVPTTSLSTAPQAGSIFNITSDDVEEPRQFRVLTIDESEKHQYTITGLLHDPNKYARIEQGIYFDDVPYSNIPAGVLTAPTSLSVSERAYIEGGLKNSLFAVDIGWVASSDLRTEYYEIEKAAISGAYRKLGETGGTYFEDKPVKAGTYWYRVRGRSAVTASAYISTEIGVLATTSGLPDITGLQVVGGGYEFTGKDCEIEWSATSSTVSGVLKDYKVVVVKGDDDTPLRTDYVVEPTYTYTYDMNTDDNSGTPIRNPKFSIYGRDIYGGLSANPATHVMTNPIPTMAGTTPTVTAIFKGLKIDWSNITPADTDLDKYKVYCDTSTPPSSEIAEVGVNTTSWVEPNLSTSAIYYAQIEPYDGFGVGTKSNATGGTEPIPVNVIDIEGELTESIAMSDSDDNSAATLARLYDRNITSDGVSYTVSGTDTWIQYDFGLENFIDRVSVYTADANAHVYIAYKRKDGEWSYLKAEVDHTLDSDGELVTSATVSGAQTDYWQLAAGKQVAIFPQRVIADECRLYLTGTYTTEIYELIFMREVIAEQVTADNLSSISANIGTITAGIIQSANLSASEGVLLDLDTNDFKIGGTTDPKFFWDNSEDTLFIDGTIDASRRLNIQEGGYIVVGNKNVVLSSVSNSLYVAPDGGRPGNNYIELKDGELDSYYWNATESEHEHYKSVTRIESGVASNGSSVTIPGIFLTQPTVMISPNSMDTYIAAYSSQSQKIVFEALHLQETVYGNKKWGFAPRATLQLSSGSVGQAINDTETRNVATYNSWAHLHQTPVINAAANTRTVSATMSVKGYTGDAYSYQYGYGEAAVTKYRYKYYAENMIARLYVYRSGAWAYIDSAVAGSKSNYNATYTKTLTTTQASDITKFYCCLVHSGKRSDFLVGGDSDTSLTDFTYQQLVAISYTSDQVSATALANGTLNWIAIGS